jgi:hypothetical protein
MTIKKMREKRGLGDEAHLSLSRILTIRIAPHRGRHPFEPQSV